MINYLKIPRIKKFSGQSIYDGMILDISFYYTSTSNKDIGYYLYELMDHTLFFSKFPKAQYHNFKDVMTVSSSDDFLKKVIKKHFKIIGVKIFFITKFKLQEYSEYKRNERNKKIEKLLN